MGGIALAGLALVQGGARAKPREAPREAPPDRPAEVLGAEPGPAVREEPADRLELRSAAAEEGQRLVIRVLYEDGTPLPETHVVAHRAGRWETALTDEAGRVEVAGFDGAPVVHIVRQKALLLETELERGRGEVEVRLPSLNVLRGRVLIDGQVPVDRVRLGIVPAPGAPALPRPSDYVWTQCSPRRFRPGIPYTVQTGEGGEFAFHSLPDGWTGSMSLMTRGLEWIETYQDLNPGTYVVLHATWRPALTGRVVSAAGEPVPEASISAELTCSGSYKIDTYDVDEEGHFRIPLGCGPQVDAKLFFASPGDGARLLEIAAVDASRGRDLGDVRLDASGEVRFRVTDPGGEPIEGAVGTLETVGRRSEPTDGEGMGRVADVPAAASALRIEAFGFRGTTLDVRGGTGAVYEAVLEPLAGVQIWTVDEAGRGYPVGKVEVVAERPFFEGEPGVRPRPEQISFGAAAPARFRRERASAGGGRVTAVFWPDRNGATYLPGVRPGLPLTVRLLDLTEMELAPPREVFPRDREWTVVIFEVPRTPHTLEGTVLDPSDQPVEGAQVYLGPAEAPLAVTDAHGYFEIEGLHVQEADLVVTAEGWAPFRRPGLVLAQSSTMVDVRLEVGREVLLRVTDPTGRSWRPDRVRAWAFGWQVGRSEPDGDGTRLFDLPETPFEAEVLLGGQLFTTAVDASAEEAELVLPPHGSVEVLLEEGAAPTGPGLRRRAWLVSGPDGPSIHAFLESGGSEPARFLFPIVPPGSWRLVSQIEVAEDEWSDAAPAQTLDVVAGERVLLSTR